MQIGMNLPVMAPGLTRELILTWSRRIDAGPDARAQMDGYKGSVHSQFSVR